MTNLKGIPAQDDFETTLSATYNGGVGSMGVFHVPDSTLPVGEYTYAVIEPGTQNMQVVKISGWTSSPKTLIVSDIAVERASGVNYVAKTHPANSTVRISNNYQFWKDIQTAINSKADPSIVGDYSFCGNEITVTGNEAKFQTSGSDMTISTNGQMLLKDKNVGPITLNQMIRPPQGGSGVEVLSEEDFQNIDSPELNTAYLRHYKAGKVNKLYFNGGNYNIGDEDINDLTEKTNLSFNDELVIADSNDSYNHKKIKAIDLFNVGVFCLGDGSDGDCVITEDTRLCAKAWSFNNLTICSGAMLSFCGEGMPELHVKNCFCNEGCIHTGSPDIITDYSKYFLVGGSVHQIGNIAGCFCFSGGCSCCAGNGGNQGENGTDYSTYTGGYACCGNGGGGAGRSGNGGDATEYNGGNGGDGGGGGFGICCGGSGGSLGATAGNCLIGGNGGNGYYGNGGNGGSGATAVNACNISGGDGGVGYFGNGGNGGGASHNNANSGYTNASYGGKGGDSFYGNGGNGGVGGYSYCGHGGKGGDGGNVIGGHYGLVIYAKDFYNNCIMGCSGNGGNGGGAGGQLSGSCGNGGNGGSGANIMIFYNNCFVQGTICNSGGCGGTGLCNGCDGEDGTLLIGQI